MQSPSIQGDAPESVKWLKEAAKAFGVSIKQSQAAGASGVPRTKPEIVEEVMRKIAEIQQIPQKSAKIPQKFENNKKTVNFRKKSAKNCNNYAQFRNVPHLFWKNPHFFPQMSADLKIRYLLTVYERMQLLLVLVTSVCNNCL